MDTETVGIKTIRLKGDSEEYEMCLVMCIVFSFYWFQRSFPENSRFMKWVFRETLKLA